MNRHLTVLPGGAHRLPAGTVSPIRSHVTVHQQARQAGHPTVFDGELHPDRPALSLTVNTALAALDGAAAMLVQLAGKYATALPAEEWQRIRGMAAGLAEARQVVGGWVDGDPTPPYGTARPGA